MKRFSALSLYLKMGIPLNVDVAKSISELKSALKDFELRLKLYRILFQGKGLDFEGYRTYSSGDDASLIDWRSSMRTNKLMVKQYKEEQDVKIMFVVDVGEHMLSGSSSKLKAEYMVEAVAALMHLVFESGDRIGLVTFSNKVRTVIMPKTGNKHFELLIETLSDSGNYGGGSNMGNALDFLADYLGPSIKSVILVSDFIGMKKNSLDKLQTVSSRFETLALMIKDPLDRQLPNIQAEVVLEDPITGEQLLVNPLVAGKAYMANTLQQENETFKIFKEGNVDVLSITTDQDFVPALAAFIQERVRKRRFL